MVDAYEQALLPKENGSLQSSTWESDSEDPKRDGQRQLGMDECDDTSEQTAIGPQDVQTEDDLKDALSRKAINRDPNTRTPSHEASRLSSTRTPSSGRLVPLREVSPDVLENRSAIDGGLETESDGSRVPRKGAKIPAGVQSTSTRRPSGSQVREKPLVEGTNSENRRASVSRESDNEKDKVLKLSPSRIQELTSSPDSLPLRAAPLPQVQSATLPESPRRRHGWTISDAFYSPIQSDDEGIRTTRPKSKDLESPGIFTGNAGLGLKSKARNENAGKENAGTPASERRLLPHRTVSTPPPMKRRSSQQKANGHAGQPTHTSRTGRAIPSPLQLDRSEDKSSKGPPTSRPPPSPDPAASPMPSTIPLPPLSIPTYLQLELSASRPSPLYIHRSVTSDFPYESSKVKFERLLNFLLLPPQLEAVLWFGALACADAWLYTFTILPLRFFKALGILCEWWGTNLLKEARDIGLFIYLGLGRMWQRHTSDVAPPTPFAESPPGRRPSASGKVPPPMSEFRPGEPQNADISQSYFNTERRRAKTSTRRHRRTKSTPSALLPNHKADLLKGLVVLFSCLILMKFDASRMYHGIRGQAAIKLYVIYNVLEVCDRLFSALGQDVFECLFSRETLERNPDGRSKLLRPFGMFLLALSYNVIHSTFLFYQVITLNVAVNSYSNALLTLLMSNQFVEIKSTVFKKFEKENLFQLTCADVVERFQLWLMLLIIALRNIVEVGGLSLTGFNPPMESAGAVPGAGLGPNPSNGNAMGGLGSTSILPKSFTIFPVWTGQVLGPFLLVLGSEMLVDWLKHAYITKFNNTKPAIYGRFLDVLAKDYYSNAFADQNLTRRLGLPVLPLSCLFIRAAIQTYHMLLATHLPLPIPSTSTSLTLDDISSYSSSSGDATTPTSAATTAALAHLDTIIRRALGRSTFGAGHATSTTSTTPSPWWWFLPPFPTTVGDAIALLAMCLFFLGIYFVMLATKLVLGMALLGFARGRYKDMKERERSEVMDTGGRRTGGWGVVEVDDDKKRWIYQDDPEGGRRARERDRVGREKGGGEGSKGGGDGGTFGAVSRYTMVAKRIW